MFSFFRKDKPRVYLDKMVVVPRDSFKKWDEMALFQSHDIEAGLRARLYELFSLPHISSRKEPKASDLALEVIVHDYQGGEMNAIDLGVIPIPLIWRPRVQVASRLFNITSGKTQASFHITEKMPWGQFLRASLTLSKLLGLKPIAGNEEMGLLLLKACERLLAEMADAVR